MRSRNSRGGVTKQRGRWRGHWYESGIKKSRVLGLVRDMTKGEAREAVAKIVAEQRVHKGSDAIRRFRRGRFFQLPKPQVEAFNP